MKPSTPNHVAPISKNTVAVPIRRLPVGHLTRQDAPSQTWRIWVPTEAGGTLRIRHIIFPRTTGNQLKLSRPNGGPLVEGTTDITHEVERGQHGEYQVASIGEPGAIQCDFTQKAWSRESEAQGSAPLIPWNFYYWPAAYAGWSSESVVQRYAEAVGKAVPSDRTAERWEEDHHRVTDTGWAGHCHNASPASAIFEVPTALSIRHGNGPEHTFAADEMKLLATEFYGNFKHAEYVWELRGAHQLSGGPPILAFLKPGGEKTEEALLAAFKSYYPRLSPTQRASLARNVVGGDASGFADRMKREMGIEAARFYAALIQHMRIEGHPLSANMRSYVGYKGPEEVWNQVYFYYEARYSEVVDPERGTPAGDDHYMKIECDLYSNMDSKDPSEKDAMPAVVQGGVVVPTSKSQVYNNVWHIEFAEDGTVDEGSTKADWKSLTGLFGAQLYAPMDMLKMGPVRPTRPSELSPPSEFMEGLDPAERVRLFRLSLGNPAVGQELLQHLRLRARFRAGP
ncbi:Hypothetical protein A7982_11374 [Minicystis rosea]|nr:Hypothetical protein A7982_11374 [Minicystis rosea]